MLNTQVKTHIVVLKDGQQLPITKAEYTLYREEVESKNFNSFITIQDTQTGETFFEGRCSEIKEFKKKKMQAVGEYIYYCDFGRKHDIKLVQYGDGCECKKEFDTLGMLFRHRLKEMGHNVIDPKKITEKMRKEYKDLYLK